MNVEEFKKAGEKLYHQLHLPTWPVGITYIKKEEEIPEQALRPSAMGQKWSLCQAVTYARRHGRPGVCRHYPGGNCRRAPGFPAIRGCGKSF